MASQNIGHVDPDEVFLIFGTKRISGFPQAQYFSATKRTPDVVVEEGTDGEVCVVTQKGNVWDASITLMMTSRSNDDLWDMRQLHLNTPGGVLLPFVFSHKGTKLVSAKAVIAGPPTITYSNGVEQRTWPLILTFFEGKFTGLSA